MAQGRKESITSDEPKPQPAVFKDQGGRNSNAKSTEHILDPPVGLLDASGGGCGLASGLGGQLLAGRLAAGGLAGCLLRASHGSCSAFAFALMKMQEYAGYNLKEAGKLGNVVRGSMR